MRWVKHGCGNRNVTCVPSLGYRSPHQKTLIWNNAPSTALPYVGLAQGLTTNIHRIYPSMQCIITTTYA